MKALWGCLTLALLLSVAGCHEPTPSLHPLIREDDAVFEPALVGQWCEESEDLVCDDDAIWTFEKDGERTYSLTIKALDDDGDETWVFKIRLARIEERHYLDATLAEQYVRGKKVDTDFLLPWHMFGWIEVEHDAVRIRLLDYDWVRDALKEGGLELAHVNLEEGFFLITAGPEELQEFARKYSWHEEAFALKLDLMRRTPAQQF